MKELSDIHPSDFHPLESIYNAGFSVYLQSYSAIDSFINFGKQNKKDAQFSAACFNILTNAGTADLAKLFENLRYPGVTLADAALEYKGCTFYFSCVDSSDKERYFIDESRNLANEKSKKINNNFFIENNRASFKLLEFYQDYKTCTFYDPYGMYQALIKIRQGFHYNKKSNKAKTAVKASPLEILKNGLNHNSGRTRAIMDAALILAKCFPADTLAIENAPSIGSDTESQISETANLFSHLNESAAPGQEEQRFLLSALMTSANPASGLVLLKSTGFISKYWSELAILDKADQAKEFHPEGNVWKHTMETFRYRKSAAYTQYDLRLSLALLLHDTGKPLAVSSGGRHFDSHAELGEIQARKFLGRLGFSGSLTNEVCFLVRNHMLTAALPRLPLFRTEEIMSSDLFPVLLELYRCDEASSFKGLESYYKSSAAYQSYLQNRYNPYRSADGKKISRRQIIGNYGLQT